MRTAHSLSQPEPAAKGALAPTLPRPAAVYAVYALFVCALFWPTLSAMAETWFASSAYHHGVLVAPAALWMIRRSGVPLTDARPSLAACAGVFAAAIIWLLGRAASVNVVEQSGFVSLLISGAAAIFGPSLFRRLAFPLLFLYFMVPVGGIVTPFLQRVTADGAVALLNLTGVPAAIDGLLITTGSGAYEIAEACAGLNFLLAALMVSAIYSWIAFRGRRKMAAFFAFAIVFAIVANVARAYLVILVATLTAGKYEIGADHVVFGWVFYGFLLFALIAVGRGFADAPRADRGVSVGKFSTKGGNAGFAAITVALAINAAAAGYAYAVIDRPSPVADHSELPHLNAAGWSVSALFPGWRASLGGADRTLHAAYQREGAAVQLAAAYFDYDRRGAEIAGGSSNAGDWRRIGARTIRVEAFGATHPIYIETLEDRWGQRLDVARLYWLGDRIFVDARALKARIAFERLTGQRSSGGVIYVAASGSADLDAEVLRRFLADAEPLAVWLARVDSEATN